MAGSVALHGGRPACCGVRGFGPDSSRRMEREGSGVPFSAGCSAACCSRSAPRRRARCRRAGSKTSPARHSRSSRPARKAASRRTNSRPTRASSTTRSRRCRATSTQGALEQDYLSEKFGVAGPGHCAPRNRHGRARNRARQPRHPAHLRRNARGRDVRLRLGRRQGPRPAAAARPRAGLRGGARHPRRQRLRTAAQRALVHAERAVARIRRRTEEGAARKGPRRRTGHPRPRRLGRRRQRLRGDAAAESTGFPRSTFADAIAGFAFIGSIFGNGGGDEVANSNFLARLETKFGTKRRAEVFRDLREVNDPEAPTTTSKPFPYDQVPTGADARARR